MHANDVAETLGFLTDDELEALRSQKVVLRGTVQDAIYRAQAQVDALSEQRDDLNLIIRCAVVEQSRRAATS